MPGRTLSGEALDLLMPMHAVIATDGTIRHAGPTLARLRPAFQMAGQNFHDVFEVRRPRNLLDEDFGAIEGAKIHLELRGGARTPLKGVAVSLGGGNAFLLNLSFGIAVVDAVRDYRLTGADFAPTDLAIEMLYLVEAKSAAMEESRKLNLRLHAAKMEAEEQAFSDPVTGLRNRRALDQVMARMIDARAPFSVLHLDLDYFKQVNDTLGHAAGDHVLRVVGQLLMAETRRDDTIARVGGDEFVIVLNGVTDPQRVDALARRIIARVSEPISYESAWCKVSTSVGSTISSRYQSPRAECMHRDADAALYASKRAGRGRHVLASDDIAFASPPERRAVGHSAA